MQAGISADLASGWFGSLRLRYFGERPLVEDGSVKSDGSTVVNLRAGFRAPRWALKVDVLNLFDSDDHDIDYFYASRLPGEASGGVEDVHYHILEPRTFRVPVLTARRISSAEGLAACSPAAAVVRLPGPYVSCSC